MKRKNGALRVLQNQSTQKSVKKVGNTRWLKMPRENTDIIRIFAEPFAHNIASCRALEKAGFQYEGTLKSNAVKCGNVVDMKMYAFTRVQ